MAFALKVIGHDGAEDYVREGYTGHGDICRFRRRSIAEIVKRNFLVRFGNGPYWW